MTATLLVALFLVAGIQVTIQQKCHSKDLETCALGLAEYAANNEVPFPRNKEEMDKQCEILKNVRDCGYNYSTNCISQLTRTLANVAVASTAEKMRNFCTDGHELNKKFLDNAICINDNYGGVTPCIKIALATMEILPKKAWRDRLPTFCCALGKFRSCLRTHYSSSCNQDVVELIETIIEFGLTDLTIEACDAVESSVTCPELPPPGSELDGSYKDTLVGQLIGPFMRE